MPDTMLPLPDDLARRLAELATARGVAPEQVLQAAVEQYLAIDGDGDPPDIAEDRRRWAEFEQTRMGLPQSEVAEWLQAIERGERPPMPDLRYIP